MNLQQQADLCIAQGALTNSKRPSTFVEGVYPTHLVRGQGCTVWDTQSRKYIDFICGLGSNLLGYANMEVDDAVTNQLIRGVTLSLGTPLEIHAAERIKSVIPFVDHVRFLKTGTEASMAALRIARAYHGVSKMSESKRCYILSDGYHGHADEFIALTRPAVGVPYHLDPDRHHYPASFLFPLTGNEHLIAEAAAVIIEPIITDASDSRIAWLKQLRETCTEYGTLLIFDEIITGFRYPKFCAANYYGIEPDIILLGKAIANGLPLSVVAGKKEIMNCGDYFVSSTFAGETLSLAACCKVIELLRGGRYSLDTLWQKGSDWLAAFNALWPEKIQIEGYPTRGRFVGDELTKALFWQEACKSGLLFGPSWFFNFPLAAKSEQTLSACKDIICKIKGHNVKLEGQMPRTPFAETMRRT